LDVDGTTNLDVVDIDGAVDMASTLTVAGEVFIAEKLSHTGDTDTHFKFAGANDIRIVAGGVDHVAFDGTIVFNQSAADMDLRVESTGNQNMLFIDSANDVVNIGGGTQQTGDVLSIHGSGTNTVARMYNTNAGADGSIFIFQKDSSSPADNDVLGDIRFHGNDDGSTMTQYAQIKGTSADVTNGTEDGQLVFNAILNGTNRERLKINATEAVFNEEGQDLDFRVESNGNANMLFVDAGNGHVNIGTASDLGGVLNVNGNVNVTGQGDFSTEVLVGSSNTGLSDNTLIFRTSGAAFIDHNTVGQGIRFRVSASSSLDTAAFDVSTGEMVINEEGADYDFRVESNGNANMLFVDAGNDRVGIGASTTNSVLHAATSGTGSIPTDHFIQTTDANTVFTAINTSDSATYSAIKLETRQTQASGFMIANEFQSAFNGDLVFRSRNAGTTSNENFRIKSSGSIIFTGKPATSPIFEMVNPDNEDTDTGRETSLRFSGHRSGGEDVVNAQISGHHAGSSDNDNGLMIFFTNNGSGLDEKMRLNFDEIIINQSGNDQDLRVESDNNANMFVVDAGNDVVNIGGVTVETGDQLSVHGSGTNTIQRIYNTNAGTGGAMLIFQKQSSSAANDDNLGDIRFHGNDAAGNLHQYGRILCNSSNVTNGSEQGQLFIQTSFAGSATDVLKLGADAVFNEGGNDIGFRVESDSNAHLIFADAGESKVAIGTNTFTAVSSTCNVLHVAGGSSDAVTPVMMISDADGSVEGNSTILECVFSGDNTFSSAIYVKFTDSGGTQGSISGTGDGTVTYNTSSDERLKQSIQDTASKWDLVKSLQVRDYEWKKSGKQETGFIAQELHDKWAQPVKVGGEDVEVDPWSVDYGKLTPILTKALQEAMEKIEHLESEIAKLKGE